MNEKLLFQRFIYLPFFSKSFPLVFFVRRIEILADFMVPLKAARELFHRYSVDSVYNSRYCERAVWTGKKV